MNKKLKKGLTISTAAMAMGVAVPVVTVMAAPVTANGWVQADGKWYYYVNGVKLVNAWAQDSHGWCFLGADGAAIQEGWAKDSIGWCYIRNYSWVNHATWAKDSAGWQFIGTNGYWDATVAAKATNPIDDATAAVVKAEASKTADDVAAATTAIAAMKGATPETAALTARVNAIVVEFAVTSVDVPNAATLVINFSQPVDKDTVIDDNDYLLQGVVEIDTDDVAEYGNYKAKLSNDGKQLTVYVNGEWFYEDYAWTIKVVGDVVKSTDGDYAPTYKTYLHVNDETRPTVTGVKAVGAYIYDITLSEPIMNNYHVDVLDEDDNSVLVTEGISDELKNNNQTIRLFLDKELVDDGDEVTIKLSYMEDYADNGNVATPYTKTVTINKTDNTKPVVESITAVADNELKVQMSENIYEINPDYFEVSGTTVSADSKIDGDDDSIVHIYLDDSILTSAAVTFDVGAFTDYSGNTNKLWNQVVSFKKDSIAPKITSYKVVTIENVNYLKLQFSEKVNVVGTSNLNFKYLNDFGVNEDNLVAAANVETDDDDASIVYIKLVDTDDEDLAADKEYSVKFAEGYFTDKFNNDMAEKTITFTDTTTSAASKLQLDGDFYFDTDEDGEFLAVYFKSPVNVTSAKNISNYIIEGAAVDEVVIDTNNDDGAYLKVYLKDNTVSETGYYDVTVKGIKGYYSSVGTMDSKTLNLEINENVRPTVKSKVIGFGVDTTTVKVTFSEAIVNDTVANRDYYVYVDGKKVEGDTVTNSIDPDNKKVVTFTIDESLSDEIADGKEVKLVATDDLDLADGYGNIVNADTIIIYQE